MEEGRTWAWTWTWTSAFSRRRPNGHRSDGVMPTISLEHLGLGRRGRHLHGETLKTFAYLAKADGKGILVRSFMENEAGDFEFTRNKAKWGFQYLAKPSRGHNAKVRVPAGLSTNWWAEAYRFANFSLGGPDMRKDSVLDRAVHPHSTGVKRPGATGPYNAFDMHAWACCCAALRERRRRRIHWHEPPDCPLQTLPF